MTNYARLKANASVIGHRVTNQCGKIFVATWREGILANSFRVKRLSPLTVMIKKHPIPILQSRRVFYSMTTMTGGGANTHATFAGIPPGIPHKGTKFDTKTIFSMMESGAKKAKGIKRRKQIAGMMAKIRKTNKKFRLKEGMESNKSNLHIVARPTLDKAIRRATPLYVPVYKKGVEDLVKLQSKG